MIFSEGGFLSFIHKHFIYCSFKPLCSLAETLEDSDVLFFMHNLNIKFLESIQIIARVTARVMDFVDGFKGLFYRGMKL